MVVTYDRKMKNILPRSKKGVGSSGLCNNVDIHEASLQLARESTSDTFRTIDSKLKKFRTKNTVESTNSDEVFEWTRIYVDLQREAEDLSRQCLEIRTKFLRDHSSKKSGELRSSDDDVCSVENEFLSEVKSLVREDDSIKTEYSDEVEQIIDIVNNLSTQLYIIIAVNSGSLKVVPPVFDSFDTSSNGILEMNTLFARYLLEFRERIVVDIGRLDKKRIYLNTELKPFRKLIYDSQDKNIQYLGSNIQLPKDLKIAIDDLKNEINEYISLELLTDEYLFKVNALISQILLQLEQFEDSQLDMQDFSQTSVNIHWSKEDKALLVAMFQNWCKSNTKSTASKSTALLHISKQLNHTHKECEELWDALTMKAHHKEKRKAAINERSRQIEDILQSGLQQIGNLRSHVKEKVYEAAESQISCALASELNTRLQILKELKVYKDELKYEEKLRHNLTKEKENRCRIEKDLKRREDIEICIKKYRRDKEERLATEECRQMKKKQEESYAKLRRMNFNTKRVKFREEDREAKLLKIQEAVKKVEEEKRKAIQRLKELATKVPYYHVIQETKADLSKTTASRKNDVFESAADIDLKDFQHGLKKLTTFTNERFFSDSKFRVFNALHESGLVKTAYAKALVKRIVPRETERTTGIEPF